MGWVWGWCGGWGNNVPFGFLNEPNVTLLYLLHMGHDFPLVIAVKHGTMHLVRRLLDLRADSTVRSYVQTHHRVERFTWTGPTVAQLAYPGTAIACLMLRCWTGLPHTHMSQMSCCINGSNVKRFQRSPAVFLQKLQALLTEE